MSSYQLKFRYIFKSLRKNYFNAQAQACIASYLEGGSPQKKNSFNLGLL